jgi:hypothetical protein
MKWILLIFGILAVLDSLLLLELMRVMPGAPLRIKILDLLMGVSGIMSIIYGIKLFKNE